MKNCTRAKNLTLQSLSQWLCHTVGHEFFGPVDGAVQKSVGFRRQMYGKCRSKVQEQKKGGSKPSPHPSQKPQICMVVEGG